MLDGSMSISWQKQRGQFNHDWLKNRYLPAIAKWMNLLDKRVEDASFLTAFPSTILPQWMEYRRQAQLLAETFEVQMSPRVLLDALPLSGLSSTDRNWLGAAIHGLWIVRYPAKKWVADAASAIKAVDTAYKQLQEVIAMKEGTDVEHFRAHRSDFSRFQDCCQALARTFEQFPVKVLVV